MIDQLRNNSARVKERIKNNKYSATVTYANCALLAFGVGILCTQSMWFALLLVIPVGLSIAVGALIFQNGELYGRLAEADLRVNLIESHMNTLADIAKAVRNESL